MRVPSRRHQRQEDAAAAAEIEEEPPPGQMATIEKGHVDGIVTQLAAHELPVYPARLEIWPGRRLDQQATGRVAGVGGEETVGDQCQSSTEKETHHQASHHQVDRAGPELHALERLH